MTLSLVPLTIAIVIVSALATGLGEISAIERDPKDSALSVAFLWAYLVIFALVAILESRSNRKILRVARALALLSFIVLLGWLWIGESRPERDDLPGIPDGWAWALLGSVTAIGGGIQKQPKRAPASNPMPFLRVANVGRGTLDLGEVHEIEVFEGELGRYGLARGDLLVVEGNGSPDQIGRSAMWHGEIEPCVHQNHLIRVHPREVLNPSFLEIYWNSPSASRRVQAVASSTSGLHTLSTGKLKGLPVVVPPVEEQARIVTEVERQMSFFEACERAVDAGLERSAALRRSVLKAAFEGRLVPQDPTDEPASVLLERIRAERAAAPKAKTRRAKAKS